MCIGGRRAAPPEGCGGAWAFLELRQRYSPVSIARHMLELLSPLIADAYADDDEHDDDDRAEELGTLLRWVRIDRFDRRAVNRQLVQPDVTPTRAVA